MSTKTPSQKAPIFNFEQIVGIKKLSATEVYYCQGHIQDIFQERTLAQWNEEFEKIGLSK